MSGLNIGVIGAGLMGHGIGYLLAAAGHNVRIYDPSTQWRESLSERLESARALLGGDPALLGRISAHEQMAPAMKDVAFVFEAAPEKLPLKQQLFAELEALTAPTTILASNSSAIPSTRIGEKLKHRDRVVGTHFWNPPHLVPLVEVTQNEKTSDETVARTMALLRDAGRNPVHVKKDIPGFVGNRLQHALKREAIALIASGVCDAETIDEVVKSGFGARMAVLGPMEQTDLVGVDLTLDIQNVLLADLDRSTEPTQFIKDKVAAGKLGMRTGEGFRKWTPQSADAVRERLRNFLAEQAKAPRRGNRIGAAGAGSHFSDPVGGGVRPEQRLGAARRRQRHADTGHGHHRPDGGALLSADGFHRRRVDPDRAISRPPPPGWPGLGVLHFVIGRYCNFRANQVAGINLTAPVVQLQVVVTMVLAVIVLHEPCTALQMIGGALILAGSLITQRQPPARAPRRGGRNDTGRAAVRAAHSRGIFFRLGRRHRLRHDADHGALRAGAHRADDRHPRRADRLCRGDGGRGAGAVVSAPLRRNVFSLEPREHPLVRPSGVLVAAAQGFFFCAVAVAPVLFVMPLLQTSLVFRLLFSTWLSPNHEVFGPLVMVRRGDIHRRCADRVDRQRTDPHHAARSRAARPHAALAGVSYLPFSM